MDPIPGHSSRFKPFLPFMLGLSLLVPGVSRGATAEQPAPPQEEEGEDPAYKERPWKWNEAEERKVGEVEKAVKKEGNFFVFESAHWLVRTEVSARFTAELACFMDLYYEKLHAVLGLPPKPKIPQKPTVQIFAQQKDYAAIFNDNSRGHYRYLFDGPTGRVKELCLYSFIIRPEERDFARFYYQILLHEGTHLLLRTHLGKERIPVFLDEGIATYFQFWDLRASREENLSKRYSRSFYRYTLQALQKKDYPSLEGYMALKPEAWNPDKMGMKALTNYALGESFIETLLTQPEAKGLFEKILTGLLDPNAKEKFGRAEIDKSQTLWHAQLDKLVLSLNPKTEVTPPESKDPKPAGR
ncbi:MAG: hypothetical protein HY291_17065 [Planctomycetes bacterium]|nr:hypothetical protein [Planctomycetota bacterium]